MAKKVASNNLDIEGIVRKAKNAQAGSDIYSNHQRITATNNEIFIDFYVLTPDPTNNNLPIATFLQRVILPITVGLELGTSIQLAAKNVRVTVTFDPDTVPHVAAVESQENK